VTPAQAVGMHAIPKPSKYIETITQNANPTHQPNQELHTAYPLENNHLFFAREQPLLWCVALRRLGCCWGADAARGILL